MFLCAIRSSLAVLFETKTVAIATRIAPTIQTTFRLVGQVITVSFETVKLVSSLATLSILADMEM